MSSTRRPTFLLAQRAYVDDFPPTLHQAAILADHGDVILFDSIFPNDPKRSLADPRVHRVRLTVRDGKGVLGRVRRAISLLKFIARLHGLFRRNPDVVIAYEPDAASVLLSKTWRGRRPLTVIHLHELPTKDNYEASPAAKRFNDHMLSALDKADLVVLPDTDRARFTQNAAALAVEPLVVMNCPRLVPNLPPSRLMPFLRERGVTTERVVHYHGSVGPDHNLERIVQSMRYWPKDAVFVIVGPPREPFTSELLAMATHEGVADRVVIVGRVPYDHVMSYAVGATVGVSMLDASKANWKYSAGASNKRFEYIAMGVPQVTNDGPGIRKLFVDTGVATVARYDDAEDLGQKIAAYLNDPALCQATSERARRLHETAYNYEMQFQGVLNHILAARETRAQ